MSNTFREIQTRIKHKIDTVDNWSKVEDTFIPLDGELIIYRGTTHLESSETIHFKVGDGINILKNLPFAYDTELLELAESIASLQLIHIDETGLDIESGICKGFKPGINRQSVYSITIPDSVTAINDECFLDCISLIQIDIPDSVIHIGESAFENCIKLVSITLPKQLTVIAPSTFYNCYSLCDIIFNNITSICHSAFYKCFSIKNITLPNTIKIIETQAFAECTGLQKMVLPDSIETLGEAIFTGCCSLEDLTIPFIGNKEAISVVDTNSHCFGYIFGSDSYEYSYEAVQMYHSPDGDYVLPQTSSYYLPKTLKKLTILKGYIGTGSLMGSLSLEEVRIKNNHSQIIGVSAFLECSNLSRLLIEGSAGLVILDQAFDDDATFDIWYEGTTKPNTWNLPNGVTIRYNYNNMYHIPRSFLPYSPKGGINIGDGVGIEHLNVPYAHTNQAGVVKASYFNGTVDISHENKYFLQIDNNQQGFVTVPWADTNQKIKVGETSFDANDCIDIKAGNNIGIEADISNKSIIISSTYIPPADKYHSTGTWSGLTYTATDHGSAPELKFTIPTGTTNTTVAIGNHTHDSYSDKDHHHDDRYILLSEKGTENGVATLDNNGLVPSSQLPSYVDDVLEGKLISDTEFYLVDASNNITTKVEGEKSKIYVDVSNHKCYRYSGSIYVEIIPSISLSNDDPTMNGIVSAGTANMASRSDHIHPSDTSKLSLSAGATQTVTGTIYSIGEPSIIGNKNQVSIRACPETPIQGVIHVGQINVSNNFSSFKPNQWGAQMSAYDGENDEYNHIRVSHEGLKYIILGNNNTKTEEYTIYHEGNLVVNGGTI